MIETLENGYSFRAIQLIPTWQGFNDFQKSLHLCPLDKNSLSKGWEALINKFSQNILRQPALFLSWIPKHPRARRWCQWRVGSLGMYGLIPQSMRKRSITDCSSTSISSISIWWSSFPQLPRPPPLSPLAAGMASERVPSAQVDTQACQSTYSAA